MTIDIFCPRCNGDNLEKVQGYKDTEKNTFNIPLHILSVQVYCKDCDEDFTVQKLYTEVNKSEELDKNNVISA